MGRRCALAMTFNASAPHRGSSTLMPHGHNQCSTTCILSPAKALVAEGIVAVGEHDIHSSTGDSGRWARYLSGVRGPS